MLRKLSFHPRYFWGFLVLLLTEICIALFFHDRFVRPYLGDVLVVILVYCFIKAFLNLRVIPATIGVLLFAFLVEGLQYLNLVERLGWQHSILAKTVLGTSFSWWDMVSYVVGALFILLIDKPGIAVKK